MFEQLVSCLLPLHVFAFSYVMTNRHIVECCFSASQETQNPSLKTSKDTAKNELGLIVVFLTSFLRYHASWTHFIFTVKQNIF